MAGLLSVHDEKRGNEMAFGKSIIELVLKQAKESGNRVRERAPGYSTGYEDGAQEALDALEGEGYVDSGALGDRFRAARAAGLANRAGRLAGKAAAAAGRAPGGQRSPLSDKAQAIEAHAIERSYANTELAANMQQFRPFTIIAMASVADNGAFATTGVSTPEDMDCVGIYCDAGGISISVFTIAGQPLFSGGLFSTSIFTPSNFQAHGFPYKAFLPRATQIVVTGVNISGGEVNAGLYLLGYTRPSNLVNR
jgi:hypothetical protein